MKPSSPSTRLRFGLESGGLGSARPGRAGLAVAALIAIVAVALLVRNVQRVQKAAISAPLRLTISTLPPPPPIVAPDGAAAARRALVSLARAVAQLHRTAPTAESYAFCASAALTAGALLTARDALLRCERAGGAANVDVLDALGAAQISLGLPQDAAATYTRVEAVAPDQVTGYLGLAHALTALHKDVQATKWLKRADDLFPKVDLAQRVAIVREYDKRLMNEQALARAESALKSSPGTTLLQVTIAALLAKTNRCADAETLLKQVVRAKPTVGAAHSLLGSVLIDPNCKRQQVAEAESHFLTALQQNDRDLHALQGLTRIYLQQNRLKEAAYITGRLVVAQPAAPSAWTQFARAWGRAGYPGPAAQANALASLLANQSDRETTLRAQRDKDRSNWRAHYNLSLFLMQTRAFGDALVEIEAAAATSNNSPSVLTLYPQLFHAVGLNWTSAEPIRLPP